MPEGPEVKRMADQLQRWVGCELLSPPLVGGRYADVYPTGWDEFAATVAVGVKVTGVAAKGKFLYWTFDNDWSMWVTLGMSGTWAQNPDKHEAMKLYFMPGTDDDTISFVDARHFGTVRFVKGKEALDEKLRSMRWDSLEKDHSTTAIWWFLQDARKNLHDKPISVVLMDQSIFPGIGNYLRAEILYASKVSPWRLLKDVTYEELDIILKNARSIMLTSYQSGGATIATYRDPEGNKGQAQSRFACYGRKHDPLGNPVVKEQTPDGRTIHWVKELQK
jgi:DNA-formamidopyrimidine glycosylase